ncbi:NAD(P)/FAD-dependent oxidoreductase [Sphingomonas sp.]|uniref:NAD(P)/FAD-dependent oxidoreductase n=1 Tax=Sphingomonas sp. TaxID=28214 RepID=UPI001B28A93A|nr:NAD(P)/FAD-dependent oxidoreductase [Sphingomonas sp.]MBO9711683.1 NAD(P)/FAD-dependent oxidoreductase [Sphingomonas sp.]
MDNPLDCLVIGAGPAGLTAAIYLARFHLRVRVLDAGDSRAALIPRTRNHAGFPEGISGPDLLARMREQARQFGAVITPARVDRLERAGERFRAWSGELAVEARAALLATGVVNRRPPIDPETHDAALAAGLLRYCPICDGYEVTDRKIAVIGTGSHGCREAIFLRMYSADVTLIAPDAAHRLDSPDRAKLAELGIAAVDGPCVPLRIDGRRIVVPTPGAAAGFDTVYPALGSDIRSELAVQLGARASEDGCIVVDAHQRTSIARLYAAGDVVKGLDQISHAMGEAGVAATTIRNDLAEECTFAR